MGGLWAWALMGLGPGAERLLGRECWPEYCSGGLSFPVVYTLAGSVHLTLQPPQLAWDGRGGDLQISEPGAGAGPGVVPGAESSGRRDTEEWPGARAGSLLLIDRSHPTSLARETGLYGHHTYALQQSIGLTGEGCAHHSLSFRCAGDLGQTLNPRLACVTASSPPTTLSSAHLNPESLPSYWLLPLWPPPGPPGHLPSPLPAQSPLLRPVSLCPAPEPQLHVSGGEHAGPHFTPSRAPQRPVLPQTCLRAPF